MFTAKAIRAIFVLIATSVMLLGATSIAHATLSPSTGPTTGGTSVTVNGIHFVKVSAGSAHSIGLTDQGTVYAWGVGSSGALGNGGTTATSVPVPVSGIGGIGTLTDVLDISAGYNHNLALTSDGVVAWGRNVEGQLGDGTFGSYSLTPVRVVKGAIASSTAYLSDIVGISAGKYFSTALTSSGSVVAWGQDTSGQLGDGNTTNLNSPVQTLGLSNVSAIDAGYDHVLAIAGGSVYGWGANASGQLGDGSNTASGSPVQVLKGQQSTAGSSLAGATHISAGGTHSFAITASGLFGWGANASGQLGDNTTTASSLPVRVVKGASTSTSAYFEGATLIEAGSSQSFALNSSGLFSWGTNASGEAGNVVGGILPTQVVAVGGSGGLTGVVQVSSGWAHSAVVTDAGIISMGRGSTGRLGNGATADQLVPVLGPNFAVATVSFGAQPASITNNSGYQATVSSPAGSTGAVTVTGSSDIFGGNTAALPATASWSAGTFTYADPVSTPTPSSSSSTTPLTQADGATAPGSDSLANTGASGLMATAIVAVVVMLAGTVAIRKARPTRRR